MKRYVSGDNAGSKAIAVASIADLDHAAGASNHMPSFKKATVGFVGSIAFLYATAFFLSAVI